MAVTTVGQFATELKSSVSTVLEQLQRAGVSKRSDRDPLTEADKERLLAYLRTSHGNVSGSLGNKHMAVTTVAQFAAELKSSVSTVLEQLQRAGVSKGSDQDALTEADKERLLAYLRTSHGTVGGDRKKITLTKKSTSEIKQADASGKARTIQVEVGKKRTFVKRDDFVSGAAASELPAAGDVEEVDVAPVDDAAVQAKASKDAEAREVHARNRAEALARATAEVAALNAAAEARRRGKGPRGARSGAYIAAPVIAAVETSISEVSALGRTFPDPFPPDCATAWGDDRFGLWFDIEIGGVTQRMRWIEPGTFWMGSLETEPNRHADEGPRHLVTLTEGYWLADTACTQALWKAVVGDAPSHFKTDPELPVENVSWDAITDKFLPAVQQQVSDLTVALPTEAQWEYACRAARESAYWFGDTITKEQANFEAKATVPVKARPANGWGLYQMHGNVWEWCEGSAREYEEAPVENPPDGHIQISCALRGGSWSDMAGDTRSAFRIVNPSAYRHQFIGFRFSLRPIKPSQGTQAGGAR